MKVFSVKFLTSVFHEVNGFSFFLRLYSHTYIHIIQCWVYKFNTHYTCIYVMSINLKYYWWICIINKLMAIVDNFIMRGFFNIRYTLHDYSVPKLKHIYMRLYKIMRFVNVLHTYRN